MTARSERDVFKAVECREEQAGLSHRVDADVVSTAVSGAAGELQFDPRESLVRWTDGHPRRLGDDGAGALKPVGQQRARADRFEFLVAHGRDDDLAGEGPVSGSARSRNTHRCDAAFHVGRAPSVQSVVVCCRCERWVLHALGADDIEVPVQDQRRSSRWPDARDDIRSTRCHIGERHRESPAAQHLRKKRGARTLARTIDDELRIARVDRDEGFRQRDRIMREAERCVRVHPSIITPRASTRHDNSSANGAIACETASTC